MSKISIKWLNGQALELAIRKLRQRAPEVLAQEVARAALNIESGAKERSPVDTGRLRASIRHTISSAGLSAEVLTDVEYAPFVEFGTSRQAAQPFLFPAAEAEREPFKSRLEAAFKKAMEP